MGNVSSSKPLAIWAIARKSQITKEHLLGLRSECSREAAVRGKGDTMTLAQFQRCLKRERILPGKDTDVLELLFTLWDTEEEDSVNYLYFLVGLSPLACGKDDLSSLLRFALIMHDMSKTSTITRGNLETIIQCIIDTAAYCGDSWLNLRQIRKVVDAAFEDSHSFSISIDECVKKLALHPLVMRFASGRGMATARRSPRRALKIDTGSPVVQSPHQPPVSPSKPKSILKGSRSTTMSPVNDTSGREASGCLSSDFAAGVGVVAESGETSALSNLVALLSPLAASVSESLMKFDPLSKLSASCTHKESQTPSSPKRPTVVTFAVNRPVSSPLSTACSPASSVGNNSMVPVIGSSTLKLPRRRTSFFD